MMSLTLKNISGFCFYLFGITLFASYVMFTNDIYARESAWWLQRIDLPFALSAFVYGGTSLYLSLAPKNKTSKALAWAITAILGTFFTIILTLIFWGVLWLPQGQPMI